MTLDSFAVPRRNQGSGESLRQLRRTMKRKVLTAALTLFAAMDACA